MKRIILKTAEERRIIAGHPWVYDNEIAAILDCGGKPAVLEPGECADVEARVRGRPLYLGRAITNPASRITARIYSASKEGLDRGFFKRRIREAVERRIAAGYDLSAEPARIVFAEADFLPGLIIDRFVGRPANPANAAASGITENAASDTSACNAAASWLVIQFLTFGMDCRRDMILEALEEIFSEKDTDAGGPGTDAACGAFSVPSGIFERSAPVRELEGLPLRNGVISGAFPPEGIIIKENGLSFLIDPEKGQKTGHFLDQRDNRRLTGDYAARLAAETRLQQAKHAHAGEGNEPEPLRILDCFCYSGAFGITAAKAAMDGGVSNALGGVSVRNSMVKNRQGGRFLTLTAVDTSSQALELAKYNAALNGVTMQSCEADVFEFLRQAERRKERYDLVILDPPAFAKNRQSIESAVRGYNEINRRALRILNRGGILVSCSCSHALNEALFKKIIASAASDAERRLIQLDFRYQAADHPILVGYDESLYLKCGFYRVL